jgi:hypothetical protein
MDHLHALFDDHDDDDSGELDAEEFSALVASLGLGLTAEEVAAWLEHSDADEDGVVRWDEFAPVGEQLLGDLFKSKGYTVDGEGPGGESPWVELMGQDGFPYEYNRATGESRWAEEPQETAEEEAGQWEATIDSDGHQSWYNHTTGETTFEDPIGTWSEVVDGDGQQYWHNDLTGAVTYEDPSEPVAPVEIVTSVYTNERGNRVFVVQKPSEVRTLSRHEPRELATVHSIDSRWGDVSMTPGSMAGTEEGGFDAPQLATYAEESYAGDESSGVVAGEGEWGAASPEASAAWEGREEWPAEAEAMPEEPWQAEEATAEKWPAEGAAAEEWPAEGAAAEEWPAEGY